MMRWVEQGTRLTKACVPCQICGSQPRLLCVGNDDLLKGNFKMFCSCSSTHNSCGDWFSTRPKAAKDWNRRNTAWNAKRNLGELLAPCPFCNRRMVFYREKNTNKYGKEYISQYYMHEGVDGSKKSDCVLDEMQMPFIIPAGDARPDEGYIGEYAMMWNCRKSSAK